MDVPVTITVDGSAVAKVSIVLGVLIPLRVIMRGAFDRADRHLNGIRHELAGFHIETREALARHDERLASIERQPEKHNERLSAVERQRPQLLRP